MLASPHSTPFTLLYPHPSVPSPVTPFNLLHPQSPSFILLHPSHLNPHPLSPYVTLIHPPSASFILFHPSPLNSHPLSHYVTLRHPPSPSFTLLLHPQSAITPHPSPFPPHIFCPQSKHPSPFFTLHPPSPFTVHHHSPITHLPPSKVYKSHRVREGLKRKKIVKK